MTEYTLPFPPSLWACFKSGRFRTPAYRAWTNEALWGFKEQKAQPIKGKVALHFRVVAPDGRIRDIDNLAKGLLDVLVKGQIIEDDSNRIVRRLTLEWVETGPPCLLKITKLKPKRK